MPKRRLPEPKGARWEWDQRQQGRRRISDASRVGGSLERAVWRGGFIRTWLPFGDEDRAFAAGRANIDGSMRLSRHAKNETRLYRISVDDIERTVASPARRDLDERGNARLTGETGDGRPILVVVAGDDPGFVITVFLRS